MHLSPKKVEDEMEKRKEETGAYTKEGILRQLQQQIDLLSE